MARAERAFSEVVEQRSDDEARAAALLFKASVIGTTKPAQAIALCEELSNTQGGDRRVSACRLLTAELLSRDTSHADRAERELERISPRRQSSETYFVARQRIAEIAWARGDGRRAAEQLKRALSSTVSARQRERIERNLAHIREASRNSLDTSPVKKRH